MKRGYIGSLPKKTLEFENISLQEMIVASEIVNAREKGLSFDTNNPFFEKTSKLADCVVIEHDEFKNSSRGIKSAHGHHSGISSQQLNQAIVKRNRKENRPTAKTKELYKQLISED